MIRLIKGQISMRLHLHATIFFLLETRIPFRVNT